MKIIIKASNMELTPSIKEYIEDKIGGLKKFLKSFDDETVEAKIEVGMITRGQRQGDIFKAEVNLCVGGSLLRSEETQADLHAAIDLAKDDLADQIKDFKDKQQTKFMRGARSWKKFWQCSPMARFRSSRVGRILKRR